MVDVAGDRTRVVLMEMRGVFDVLKMGYRVKGKGGDGEVCAAANSG
jgi:hypothetical protein